MQARYHTIYIVTDHLRPEEKAKGKYFTSEYEFTNHVNSLAVDPRFPQIIYKITCDENQKNIILEALYNRAGINLLKYSTEFAYTNNIEYKPLAAALSYQREQGHYPYHPAPRQPEQQPRPQHNPHEQAHYPYYQAPRPPEQQPKSRATENAELLLRAQQGEVEVAKYLLTYRLKELVHAELFALIFQHRKDPEIGKNIEKWLHDNGTSLYELALRRPQYAIEMLKTRLGRDFSPTQYVNIAVKHYNDPIFKAELEKGLYQLLATEAYQSIMFCPDARALLSQYPSVSATLATACNGGTPLHTNRQPENPYEKEKETEKAAPTISYEGAINDSNATIALINQGEFLLQLPPKQLAEIISAHCNKYGFLSAADKGLKENRSYSLLKLAQFSAVVAIELLKNSALANYFSPEELAQIVAVHASNTDFQCAIEGSGAKLAPEASLKAIWNRGYHIPAVQEIFGSVAMQDLWKKEEIALANQEREQYRRASQPQAEQQDPKPYQTLGLSRTATKADITKAYHKLSMKFHPDRCMETVDGSRFKRLKDAHDLLSDDVRRSNYDAQFPEQNQGSEHNHGYGNRS